MARVTRRKFLKVSGTGALAAKAGGMAGILATGRAPAFAQGATVHWLRWNDFVPASDQLLRKEMLPAAEKELGIKINMETINANELQARITSAIQSGAGADLIMALNNHTYLYGASVVDLSDLAEDLAEKRGRTLQVCALDLQRRQDVLLHAVGRDRRHDRLSQIVVRRDRRDHVPRYVGEVSRGRQEAQSQGPAARSDAGAHLRRCSGFHLSLSVVVGRQGSRGRRQDGGHQQQGDYRVPSSS